MQINNAQSHMFIVENSTIEKLYLDKKEERVLRRRLKKQAQEE